MLSVLGAISCSVKTLAIQGSQMRTNARENLVMPQTQVHHRRKRNVSRKRPSPDFGTGEAARLLGISVDACQRLCIAGKLRAKRIDNKWRISKRDIDQRLKWKARRAA
jgi:excisionase family DNA binding protein